MFNKIIRNKSSKNHAIRALTILFTLILAVTLTGYGKSDSTSSENNSSKEQSVVSKDKSDTVNSEKSVTGRSASDTSSKDSSAKPIYDTSKYEDPEEYPFFAQLSDSAKQAYVEIVTKVEAGKPKFKAKAEYTIDDLFKAVRAVYLENPQYFWLEDGTGTSYSNESTGLVYSVSLKVNKLVNNLSDHKKAFEEAADEVLSGLDGLTDVEKERAIHDYLADYVTYKSNSLDQSAYAALVNGECVCGGYTKAFQYLMDRAGITTYYIAGTADSDGTWGSHSWNIIKLDGKYYNVDVTWDDHDGQDTTYYYYNVTTKEIKKNHKSDDEFSVLPTCTGTEYSFENIYGMPAAEYYARAQAEKRGLTSTDLITFISQYTDKITDDIVASGTGTHYFGYIIKGDDCADEIKEMMDSKEAIQDGFMLSAIKALGLNGYSWNLDYEWTDYGTGYYYMAANVSINPA